MGRLWSLRVRVVVAFFLLLTITLAVAGTQVYLSTERRLVEEIDLDLELAAEQALLHLNVVNENRYLLQGGDGQSPTYSAEDDFSIAVLSPSGEVWDHAGAELSPAPSLVDGAISMDASGDEWRVLAVPIPASATEASPGWLQVARSLSPVDDALAALATQLYIILPVAVLIAVVLSYFLAGRALRPLTRMARTAEQISPSTLDKRIGYQGPRDEVGGMATAFDAMLDRVQHAFERERRFSADASHELRTPLAAIKSGIGVSLSRERTPDEYRDTLERLDGQVDQLVRLCDDLLVLARRGRPRSADLETVDVTSLLESVVEQFAPLADDHDIVLRARIGSRLNVAGFADDLIRLFVNLLGNAFKYTAPGGSVNVDARRERGHVHVSVSDTGAGISQEHLPYLFEPFYSVDASRGRGEGGTGLGLAIAHEIAGAHGGSISVKSSVGSGTAFEVSFPALPD